MRVLVVAATLLLLAGAAMPAHAASPWANVADPVFSRVDLSPIADPPIYAIAQDATGFLWIGTATGLWRYDGYEFRSLKAERAFAPPNVESLADDAHGSLWIGTQSNGLERLDEKTETFQTWPVDRTGRRGPRSATIIALARTQDGRWWIGGDSGLDAFDPATQEFEPSTLDAGDPVPRVEAIHVDRRRGVWVGTVRGLYLRAAGAVRFRRVRLGANGRAGAFSLYEDEAGRMWAGSLNAVYVLSPNGRIVRTYISSSDPSSLVPGEQWAITEATPGTLWIGASDGGIAILDATTQRVHRVVIDRANPGSLNPGQVWQFFHDRSGLLWTANDAGGLLAYNPHNRGIYALPSYEKGLGMGDVGTRSVAAASDGSLWLGSADRVARIDPHSDVRHSYELNGNPSIQTLHVDAGDTLWIGTARGLCRLSAGAAEIECPSGAPERMGRIFTVIDVGSTLWVGTDSGVFAWDRATGGVVRYQHAVRVNSLSNDFVESLYADDRGAIWAGTASGLNRIDPRSEVVTRFEYDPRDARSLGPGQVPALVEDDRDRLWAGSSGGPLNVLDTRGRVAIRRLESAGGTFENVDGLETGADGSIWASASNTLLRIDPRTLRASVLGPADGVQQSHFWPRPTKAADGTAFFAGTYSVIVVAPDARADWTFSPPVVVTSQKSANERDVSVEFAALDYSAPQAIRYEYRLDGYDRAWIVTDAAHRVATYTNLAAGDYTLHVRGTNRAGAWSAREIELNVHVRPAWYETWWFRMLLAAFGIAAIFGFVRGRTAVLRHRAERLENLVQERTNELAEANAALEKMTIVDPLTGLHNRRFLLQRIDDEVGLVIRNGTDLVFFIVDIDHFKAVNDEFGHAAGDRVLEQMRERLEEVFRTSDFVVRWGGEEFLVVARGSSRDDAPEIAERLRVAIASRPFLLDGGQLLPKTASIGFAAFPFVPAQPHGLTWMQVVDLADHALYVAKNGGRNAWYGAAAAPDTDAANLASQLGSSGEDALSGLRVLRAASDSERPVR